MASQVTASFVHGASPRTERGISCYMTCDLKNDRFAYCAMDHIVIRKISDPSQCEVMTRYNDYTQPTSHHHSATDLDPPGWSFSSTVAALPRDSMAAPAPADPSSA